MTQIITSRGGGQGGGGGGDGDMKKAVYDPQNIGKDAFNYDNFTNTPTIPTEVSELDNDAGYITSSALSGYQTTSNLVTNLTNPDDTHYPSAKAVSDAITSSGGGDMLKSVYDPDNVSANAFDYNNFINTPTIPAESNTKTFTLSSTSDLATAQAAYDWYRNGNNPIILYTNNVYILSGVSSGFVYFVANNEMWGTIGNSRSTVSISTVTFQKDGNTIEAISTAAKYAFNFIETDKNYSTAYTPQYNGSPATKKYVDDTAGGKVSDTAYGSSWDGVTGVAPSQNAVYDKISVMDTTISSKANDSDVVKLTGNQTIAGTKTFSTSPVVPSKTTTATSSGTAIATEAQVKTVADGVATINGMISSNASSSNKLMDKNYIDDSINSVTAYYITKNAQGDQWATYAELAAATTFYSGGTVRVPTRNDYTVVLDDETHNNATTRYSYQGSGWQYQYTVNETALTQAQLDALNSGITAAKVSTYDGYASTISGKQDALTLPATPTQGHIVTWGADNETLVDGGAVPISSTVKQFAYPSVGSDITDLHNWLYTSGVATKKGAILSSGAGANESNYYEVVYFIYAMGEGTINAERSTNTGIEYVTIDYSLSGGVATVDSITSTNTGVTSVNGQTGAVTVDAGDAKVFTITGTAGSTNLATATQAYTYAYTTGKCAIIRYSNANYVYARGNTTTAYFTRAYGLGAVGSGTWATMSTLRLTVSSGSVTTIVSYTNTISVSSSAPSSSTSKNTITLVI